MSCPGITIHTPSGDVCIPIYSEIDRIPHRVGPDPDPPWLKDLKSLVTIDRTIAELGDARLRETLSQSVREAARQVDLPKGVALGDGLFKGLMFQAS
jgi:hypothetical protein